MEKLKNLLKQLGGSDELVNAISEEFNRFAQSIKEKYDREYREKIERARVVCLEEVNKEKAELARKVSVYLEAKADSIEKAAEKQRLNEDTEATNTLKRTKALLEGIELDSGNSRELQAARKKNERLSAAIESLREERNLAVRKANDANRVAKKTLEKHRTLEEKYQILESKVNSAQDGEPLTESKKSKGSQRRIDKGRRRPQPSKSTRRTLVESQVNGSSSKSSANPPKSGITIASIAASIEDD